jgi:hypothetical protein
MNALSDLDGSRWTGTAELWLDPLGNEAALSSCTISIAKNTVRYEWSHEGRQHLGSIALDDDAADFTDSWHQPESLRCRRLPDAGGLFQVEGTYGPDSDWRWRIALSLRTPSDELVLQMTNITPWGEEGRAVRMTCQRSE